MSTTKPFTNRVAGALFSSSLCATTALFANITYADAFTEALTSGKASGDLRLRYEAVDQDNALDDAEALTLRTRIGYTTGTVSNFSAMIEFEDVRVVGGFDEYAPENAGYSVVADPENTEVEQAHIKYSSDLVTAKYGRQVFTLDNHRFVGHVGWRQDRQTFDALTTVFTPAEGLTVTYAYLFKRNRIFGETADIKSNDQILNVAFKTPVGTITGYGYFLEEDDTALETTFDTIGVRFAGASGPFSYAAEYATQEKDDDTGADFDADYMLLEGGFSFSKLKVTLGYEVLGSDDGMYGFSTPLATLHKFNGWADQFLGTPAQGLVDTYLTLSSGLLGGNCAITFHEFEADEESNNVDDLGDEIDFVYSRKFGGNYNAGVKYAMYSAGDSASNKVDTDKLWVWVGMTF